MERRKHSRLKIEIDVDYKALGKKKAHPVKTRSADISMGGLRLITSEAMEKGTELDLIIRLGTEDRIKVKGVVVWRRKYRSKDNTSDGRRTTHDEYEIGIKIEPLKEEEEKRFSDFVFKQMYKMIGLPNWPGTTG